MVPGHVVAGPARLAPSNVPSKDRYADSKRLSHLEPIERGATRAWGSLANTPDVPSAG